MTLICAWLLCFRRIKREAQYYLQCVLFSTSVKKFDLFILFMFTMYTRNDIPDQHKSDFSPRTRIFLKQSFSWEICHRTVLKYKEPFFSQHNVHIVRSATVLWQEGRRNEASPLFMKVPIEDVYSLNNDLNASKLPDGTVSYVSFGQYMMFFIGRVGEISDFKMNFVLLWRNYLSARFMRWSLVYCAVKKTFYTLQFWEKVRQDQNYSFFWSNERYRYVQAALKAIIYASITSTR